MGNKQGHQGEASAGSSKFASVQKLEDIDAGFNFGSTTGFEDIEDDTPIGDQRKVVCLGCGDTGKSTFFKQVQAVDKHASCFTDENRQSSRGIVYDNILTSIGQLAQLAIQSGLPLGENEASIRRLSTVAEERTDNYDTFEAYVEDVISTWSNKLVQQTYRDRHKISKNFPGTALQHFMDKIEEIRKPDYIPDKQDVMVIKVRTTGCVEYDTQINRTLVRVVDTGGQRSERKKWVHMYDNVDVIVFTVSLTEFGTVCYEDEMTNRAWESLECFSRVVNLPVLKDVPFILIFGKADALPFMTKRVRFGSVFRNYSGNDDDCAAIVNYLKDRYLKEYKGTETGKILPVVLNVLDTKAVENVLQIMVDVILEGNTSSFTFKMWDGFNVKPTLFQSKPSHYNDITITRKKRKMGKINLQFFQLFEYLCKIRSSVCVLIPTLLCKNQEFFFTI